MRSHHFLSRLSVFVPILAFWITQGHSVAAAELLVVGIPNFEEATFGYAAMRRLREDLARYRPQVIALEWKFDDQQTGLCPGSEKPNCKSAEQRRQAFLAQDDTLLQALSSRTNEGRNKAVESLMSICDPLSAAYQAWLGERTGQALETDYEILIYGQADPQRFRALAFHIAERNDLKRLLALKVPDLPCKLDGTTRPDCSNTNGGTTEGACRCARQEEDQAELRKDVPLQHALQTAEREGLLGLVKLFSSRRWHDLVRMAQSREQFDANKNKMQAPVAHLQKILEHPGYGRVMLILSKEKIVPFIEELCSGKPDARGRCETPTGMRISIIQVDDYLF